MTRICYFICLLVCLSSCYDSVEAPPGGTSPLPAPTLSIGELVSSCGEEVMPVTQDLIICGVVTTSDESGNFYRSFFIEEDGAGVEVLGGLWDLYRPYPLGRRVTVHLRGLAVGRRFGVVQIGRMPATGDYAVDYIGSRVLLDAHVARGAVESPPEPLTVQLSELTRERCGTLVRIEHLTPVDEPTPDRVWSGYRTFADADDRRIVVYPSSYARFAASRVPDGPLALTGILQYGQAGTAGETFMLKMRDENDCVVDR